MLNIVARLDGYKLALHWGWGREVKTMPFFRRNGEVSEDFYLGLICNHYFGFSLFSFFPITYINIC